MLGILFIFVFSLLVGYPITAVLVTPAARFRGDALELGLVVCALGSFVIGWLALVTAEFSLFSISLLLVLGLLVALFCAIFVTMKLYL